MHCNPPIANNLVIAHYTRYHSGKLPCKYIIIEFIIRWHQLKHKYSGMMRKMSTLVIACVTCMVV